LIVYLDSSAAAKLAWDEAESKVLRDFLARFDDVPNAIRSSVLVDTEVRRAAARNGVSQARVSAALEKLELADIVREMFTSAGLLPGPGLRSLDALHITTALRMEADAFVTYDTRQADAARACGLAVVAPA